MGVSEPCTGQSSFVPRIVCNGRWCGRKDILSSLFSLPLLTLFVCKERRKYELYLLLHTHTHTHTQRWREGGREGVREGGSEGGREGGRDNTTIRNRLLSKLSQMLQRVDETPVTRNQKLRLYRAAVCPRLNWDLTVNNVPLSWITRTMEATATRYLKRWSGLARSADPSRLYLPPSKGGLNLPSICQLYHPS